MAAEYQDTAAKEPEYTVNADLSRTAIKAAERAQEIVNKYADSSDFEKLDAYRQEICNLTSYNHEAADNPAVKYGNPWQLIWVFDGVEETSVVCEGYAKAFQYLCDLTDFQNSNVACYTVTGIMEGGTGAGGHMWNIVTMDDGKNYLVDITNCDTGSIGAEDKLFLAAADKAGGDAYAVDMMGIWRICMEASCRFPGQNMNQDPPPGIIWRMAHMGITWSGALTKQVFLR